MSVVRWTLPRPDSQIDNVSRRGLAIAPHSIGIEIALIGAIEKGREGGLMSLYMYM